MDAVGSEGDDRKSKTIRERREELGFSRGDTAERIGGGVTPETVGRWEDVGFSEESGTILGDLLLSRLIKALDLKGIGLELDFVPARPKHGDMIITPATEEDMSYLVKRAYELDLRVAVPDGYGQKLISPKDVSDEDSARMQEYVEIENKYAAAFVQKMENMLDVLGAKSGEWKDGQTMDERLEEMDRELGEDLDCESGGNE